MSTKTATTAKADDITASLTELRKQTPALENIFNAFGPLAEAQAAILDTLADWGGFSLPVPNPARFTDGVPLLTDMDLPHFGSRFQQSLQGLAVAAQKGLPATADDIRAAMTVLEQGDAGLELARAIWDDDMGRLQALASKAGVSPDATPDISRENMLPMFSLLGSLALGPFMQRMARDGAKSIGNLQWSKGYCPICGSFPDMSLLRKKESMDSEYLAAHGGQRWLHCSCCGHLWRFRRNVCPWCETEDHKQMEYLQSEDWKTERVDACNSCKRYFVTLDTRELAQVPDTRVAPLGLVHLDIVAQEKGYLPMAETVWNRLG